MEEGILEWEFPLKLHGNGFYVSIPAVYVRSRKIEPGDLIKIELQGDGSLRMRPEPKEGRQ